MTQSDLGRLIGFDNTMVSRIELDERSPKADFLVAVARGLEIDPRYVFSKAGMEFTDDPMPVNDQLRAELLSAVDQMSDEDLQRMIEIAKALGKAERKAVPASGKKMARA
jgi:transcriptional regulator with XRE-family HTH domain